MYLNLVSPRGLRAMACAAFALVALLAGPRVARADDVLNVVGGSTPGSFFEVLEDTAVGAGLYTAEHLTINKQYAGSASVCVQTVASGKGDICTSSVEPLIFGYEKGIRLQVFLSRDPRYDYLLAVPDASPIKSLADLKGKDIGETNVGSTAEISANSVLAGAGLTPADYSYVPIGLGTQAMAAINSGKVDAMAFPSVELGMYEVVGGMKFRYFKDPTLSDIPNVGFAASPDTIAAKADLLKRFCRAIVKAAILVRVNPELAGRYFLEGSGQKVTPEAIKTQGQEFAHLASDLPAFNLDNPRIGAIPVAGIDAYTKYLYGKGLTKTLVPASGLVTEQFIAFANDFDKKAWIAQAKALK
jgi:NitT/TauT family transport system substrate-binding protein